MADPCIGEIHIFAYDFVPYGYLYCDGRLLEVNQYEDLFKVINYEFGGDGHTTFALPDMRGRIPISQGKGIGLTERLLGQTPGAEKAVVLESQLPAHNHLMACSTESYGLTASPVNGVPAKGSTMFYSSALNTSRDMMPGMISNAGGGDTHDNVMPYLGIGFFIAYMGHVPQKA